MMVFQTVGEGSIPSIHIFLVLDFGFWNIFFFRIGRRLVGKLSVKQLLVRALEVRILPGASIRFWILDF